GRCKTPPPQTQYFFRQCYVATDADEKPLRQVVEAIGDDNIVVSTDYPHSDGLFPVAIEEFVRLEGLGLAELVRRREVSATELLDASIARVEALNPEINAVVTRLYDQARAAIAAGLPAGPFTGVPYLLKDLGAHYA